MKKLKRCARRVIAMGLCLATLLLPLAAPLQVAGAAREVVFPHRLARQMALAQSPELKSLASKISIKQIKYVEAVKTLAAKKKNLRSFRWSPLLSFKFPQQLDMSQSFEFEMKPMQLQAEITTLRHEYNDAKHQVQAKLDMAYLECYITQEKIVFTDERLQAAQQELARNRASLLLGGATQADIDSMQASVDALSAELAQQMRNMEAAKTELGDRTGMNLAQGYNFANPLKDLEVPRSDLEAVTAHALANDHVVYTTRMASATAKLNLGSYESLMRNRYGSKMSYVNNYLALAKSGQGRQIDAAAFRSAYDAMLKSMDAYWNRSIKILFFTFTMEWFKGELSGTRYIEDDLYALYAACFEYTDALADQADAEKALTKQVAASYESFVNARNAYLSLANALADVKVELDRTVELNRLGKAEYSEVADKRETYQEQQIDTLDALVAFNELAIELNRTTCGALDPYFEGSGLGTDVGAQGDSLAQLDLITDPYYYINAYVADQVFEFGVSIPEGFEPEITHFELWFEGTRIGVRTAVGSNIRHLTLDYGENPMATVRLYNGNNYVDECEIDTSVMRAALPLAGAVPEEPAAARVLGSYSMGSGVQGQVSTVTITLAPYEELGVAYYSLEKRGSGALGSGQPLPIGQPFVYLGVLADSLEDIRATLYDAEQKPLYTAKLDGKTMQLVMES